MRESLRDRTADHSTVSILDSLLTGEISAVNLYTKFLERMNRSEVRLELSELRLSHAKRVRLLRRQIRSLNFQPGIATEAAFYFPSGDGSLGSDCAALTTLYESEALAARAYERALSEINEADKPFLLEELVEEQEVSVGVVAALTDGMECLVKTA